MEEGEGVFWTELGAGAELKTPAIAISSVKLKGILGNINAQYANSHVDLPSQVRLLQREG